MYLTDLTFIEVHIHTITHTHTHASHFIAHTATYVLASRTPLLLLFPLLIFTV